MSDVNITPFKEGENIVIGYLLIHPESISKISEVLSVEAFSDEDNKSIYAHLINHPGREIGLLISDLGDNLSNPDIIVQLEEFIREIDDDLMIYDYVDKLNINYKRRKGIKSMDVAQKLFADLDKNPVEVVASILDELTAVEFRSEDLVFPNEFIKRRLSGLDKRKIKGFQPTGFPTIDKYLTQGFAGGTLSIIAGRTSMGKSTLKRNMIVRLCDRGLGVLNIVPEMGFDREQDGIDTIRTGRPLVDFYRTSQWDDAFNREIESTSQYIQENWKYFVQTDPFISFAGVERDIITLVLQDKLDIVFIDLFDRLQEVSQAKSHKHDVIKRILQRQAALALKHNIHFCNIVQIRRADNQGLQDKISKNKPTIELLKDSGAFEEISDLIFLLYRESYYNEDAPENEVDVIIGKQRQGPRNKTIKLDADWPRVTLDDQFVEGYNDF